jgi:hypothetical protein
MIRRTTTGLVLMLAASSSEVRRAAGIVLGRQREAGQHVRGDGEAAVRHGGGPTRPL